MRTVILSALMGLGIGLSFAIAPAQASPISAINSAVSGQGVIDLAQFGPPPPPFGGPPPPPGYGPPPPYAGPPGRCRDIRVCRMTPYGRRCRIERVCRRVW